MLAEVCPALGLDPVDAARVVLEVAEARMVGFLRTELAARGVTPGEATLIAFGGAGPVHAASVARNLGLGRVVVPYLAAGFSALGCLLCPPARIGMIPVDATLATLTPERLRELIGAALPDRSRGKLRLALILGRGESIHEEMLPVRDPGETTARRIHRYHAFTERAYGIRPLPETVRVMRLLAVLEEGESPIALGDSLRATFARGRERHAAAPPGERGRREGAIPELAVESLPVGVAAAGPALIVLPGASAFVPEGVPYRVDEFGNLILETAN
jgi:N-methylhydantoinase A